ncbi:hypothetical protein CROQUDRAFT_92877 [Cronartium quercuum f. sp. fusiforme G11]|uniref:Uncharacterized protein n=1 Tax=Cronartium quercuum f. sp. fusiforme G11 TaxID=708437 RepID=A0A9P6TD39_9BASI|nr:hypothetical protein CROQUDRAFT_92877 [Cronartium quercuum f. sp. fusiforme G11]
MRKTELFLSASLIELDEKAFTDFDQSSLSLTHFTAQLNRPALTKHFGLSVKTAINSSQAQNPILYEQRSVLLLERVHSISHSEMYGEEVGRASCQVERSKGIYTIIGTLSSTLEDNLPYCPPTATSALGRAWVMVDIRDNRLDCKAAVVMRMECKAGWCGVVW